MNCPVCEKSGCRNLFCKKVILEYRRFIHSQNIPAEHGISEFLGPMDLHWMMNCPPNGEIWNKKLSDRVGKNIVVNIRQFQQFGKTIGKKGRKALSRVETYVAKNS